MNQRPEDYLYDFVIRDEAVAGRYNFATCRPLCAREITEAAEIMLRRDPDLTLNAIADHLHVAARDLRPLLQGAPA